MHNLVTLGSIVFLLLQRKDILIDGNNAISAFHSRSIDNKCLINIQVI